LYTNTSARTRTNATNPTHNRTLTNYNIHNEELTINSHLHTIRPPSLDETINLYSSCGKRNISYLNENFTEAKTKIYNLTTNNINSSNDNNNDNKKDNIDNNNDLENNIDNEIENLKLNLKAKFVKSKGIKNKIFKSKYNLFKHKNNKTEIINTTNSTIGKNDLKLFTQNIIFV